MPRDNNKPKIKLPDLMEYERDFYSNVVEKKATCRTNVEVTWVDGGIWRIDVTRKERVKG